MFPRVSCVGKPGIQKNNDKLLMHIITLSEMTITLKCE